MLAFALAAVMSTLPPVDAYRDAVREIESRKPKVTVEQVFVAALAAGEALERGDFLEKLSDEEYDALVRSLPGMTINRYEIVFARPDLEFFQRAVDRHGRRVDRDFFRNYAATFPDGIVPVYVEQQTDVTGCTLFGKGHIVERYAGWLRFRADHADAYKDTVRAQIARIEAEITGSDCACGPEAEVVREFEEFAREFPRSPATPRVLARIEELRESRSRIRFGCVSG